MNPAVARIAKISLPLILIALAVWGARMWRDDDVPGLVEGHSYEVWIREAEVHPSAVDGAFWDGDQRGPDLVGLVCWKEQKILETIPASDGVIARWEPVAVKPIDLVLKGGADAASLRRVGRFRMESGGVLELGVFDDDAVDRAYAGGFRVPLDTLKQGVNIIPGAGKLVRVALVIEDPDAPEQEPGEQIIKVGVSPLETPTEAMKTRSDRIADSVEKSLQDVSDTVEKEARGALDSLRQQIEDALPR